MPPKAISSVQTRKRKRESEAAPDEELSVTMDPPPPDTREATPLRSRSASEVDETSVEALLDGCTINPTDPLSPEFGGLTYPNSESDPMDVDATPEELEAGATTAAAPIETDDSPAKAGDHEIIMLDDAPMDVDTTITSSHSAIPASRFYTSSSKGKERAVSPEVPHPMENTEQDAETQEPAEAEPSEADLTKCVLTYAFEFEFEKLTPKTDLGYSHLILLAPSIQLLYRISRTTYSWRHRIRKGQTHPLQRKHQARWRW